MSAQPKPAKRLAIGGAVLALVAVAVAVILLLVTHYQATDASGAVWFVTLLIVVIIALALAAAMFSRLKLSNRDEAFALPVGSIRALLAVGIMMLLVVFGLSAMQADENAEPRLDKSFASVEIPAGELTARIGDYEKQGFSVVVTTAGVADADPAKAKPAKADLYNKVRIQGPNDAEASKQLVTAIITLLTTVVGFYFGSRTSSDAVKAAMPDGPGSKAKPPLPDSPEGLAAERKSAGETFAALKIAEQAATEQLARSLALAPLADTAAQTRRLALEAKASAALTPAADARVACVTSLDSAGKAVEAVAKAATPENTKAARTALEEAKAKLEAFRVAADALALAVKAIEG